MSRWPTVALSDIFEIARGGSPRPIDSYVTDDPNGINWITIGDACEGSKYIAATKRRIRQEGATRSRRVQSGDFLLTNSMSFGRPYIMATDGCIHDGWLVLSPRQKSVNPSFFYHVLGSDALYAEFERRASGATVKNLNIDVVKSVRVPLPPEAEQRRIAEILDAADTLRAKRRAALARLDTLTQSIFLDMFGDPALNARHWPTAELGSLATKFSDGPFGTNLKTEHYREDGVRVIRLQNVGVGRFVDDDAAFISANHFAGLRKHECVPGDVIIATLGDPNVRACVLPPKISVALNKADCVQMRPDQSRTNAAYVTAVLNLPSMLRLAGGLMHGQTRVRISMGQLRRLRIPVPPIDRQNEFASRARAVETHLKTSEQSLTQFDALFASLQHRAFRGEL